MNIFGSAESRGKFLWSPKEDITTYELAKCVGVLIYANKPYTSADLVEALIEELPENASRHFQKEANKKAA